MHLLIIVIFAHFVKIQRTFFFIAIANDREITQKKQRPGPNPDNIKMAVFWSKRKSEIVQRLFCTTMFNKQFCINNVTRASAFHFMNKEH